MRNYWLRRSWDFTVAVVDPPPGYYFGREVVISKGPYTVRCDADGMSDLRDVFNKDASIEMTALLVEQLEHHPRPRGASALYGPKRVALIAREKMRILRLIRALRAGEDFSEYLTLP